MHSEPYLSENYPIVLFDSHCLICDGFVRWVLHHDPDGLLKFSGMLSDKAQHEISTRNIPLGENGSVILLFKDRQMVESDAVIEVLRLTGHPSFIIHIFQLIPKSWRDGMYRWVSRNRYLFFKKRNYCPLPDASEADRFL